MLELFWLNAENNKMLLIKIRHFKFKRLVCIWKRLILSILTD